MKIYVIAGEKSGDFIGGLLMKALREVGRKNHNKIEFHGVGGENMESSGLKSLFPLEEINLMGFVEVIPHIFRINKLINRTVKDIIDNNPKTLVTIDSPGFTFRVAKKIKKLAPHIKLVHIVAPSVWVYKPGRAQKYADIYDHMLTLLTFEPKYFTQLGLASTCIGHPVLEQDFYKSSGKLRKEMKIEDDVKAIAVTPGSRRGEIVRHMPIIKDIFNKLSVMHKIKVIFVQSEESNVTLISEFLRDARFNYSFSTDRLQAFAASDCALAKSGTNTLEIAASGTPMVIGYKLNPVTFTILKLFIKIKFASLINIIANREIIPEYIQSDFDVDYVALSISNLLNDDQKAKKQVDESKKVLKSLGLGAKEKPSMIAAKIIADISG